MAICAFISHARVITVCSSHRTSRLIRVKLGGCLTSCHTLSSKRFCCFFPRHTAMSDKSHRKCSETNPPSGIFVRSPCTLRLPPFQCTRLASLADCRCSPLTSSRIPHAMRIWRSKSSVHVSHRDKYLDLPHFPSSANHRTSICQFDVLDVMISSLCIPPYVQKH